MKLTKYVADWIKYAKEDVRVVHTLLKAGGPANTICFHAQQAAEKSFKGFLAHHDRHVRRVHDLESLLSGCQEFDGSLQELLPDVQRLNAFYVETRYPGDLPDFSMEEAKLGAESAEMVVNAISDRLGYE